MKHIGLENKGALDTKCTRVERLNLVLPKVISILLIPLQVEHNLWNKHENENGKTN